MVTAQPASVASGQVVPSEVETTALGRTPSPVAAIVTV
jgi:hypothetical protein